MTPKERQATLDDILRLHQDGFSITDIAQKLHLPESTVQHVIDHGEPPEPQPQWPTN
ncbi:hypothetical protein Pan258_44850 [Symmachiella dynata]|uniref:helix-turn-helix domain-containing protein n=1 Tax=Symmachiella dynata TaxID=2527995 RepID=UPI00118CDBF0|nr:helix-turn-helix domain-containing protein [Symmachiella dynata]QDT50426.1 hypothetical protein Pan258_44850 [Symmachiella dynata]